MVDPVILDWKILDAVIVVLLTFCCGWGYKLWYSYLKDKEMDVKKQVEKEVDYNVSKYPKLKSEIGVKKFANRLLKLTKLKGRVEEGKSSFEKYMIFSGVVIIITAIIYSILTKFPDNLIKYQSWIFIVMGISIFILLGHFKILYNCKADVEKYLKSGPIDDMFKEEFKDE
jgi:hypothetical protein